MKEFNSNLIMEMDSRRKDSPVKSWDMTIPVETRMAFLKRYDTPQHLEIQEVCKHEFEDGECVKCAIQCEHQKTELQAYYHDCVTVCLDCGRME